MSDIVTEVFNAEGDMRQVHDIALILHDYMEEAGDLREDRKAGLLILTAELLQTGERLRASFAAMDEAMRAQADALEIESRAKRRLADEYDAAQERGDIQSRGGDETSKTEVPTAADIGVSHKDIHEARIIRDAGAPVR